MPHAYRVILAAALPDEAVEILLHAVNEGRPNDISVIHVERLGGAINRFDAGCVCVCAYVCVFVCN